MLDLRRLRYFKAIAEHGSVTAAARALNVAQPALSYHIGELERRLGAKLLERQPHGIRLTAIGQLLLEHARSIIDSFERAESELRETAAPVAEPPVISLAMIPSITPLTSELISCIERVLPEVSLHLIEARTGQSHEMIQHGRVDFAVNLVDPNVENAEPLLWEPMYAVFAPPEEGEPVRTPIPFKELAKHRLIVPAADNPMRILVEEVANQVGVHLDIAVEIDGLDPRKQAVAAGLGYTIMSWLGVKEDCVAGILAIRPIIDPPVSRPVMLEYRSGLNHSLVKSVSNALKHVVDPAFLKPDVLP